MSKPNLSFRGLADLYLKAYGAAGGARGIGSVSKCDLTHEEEEKRQPNFGRDGGVLNTTRRLTKVGIALTLQSISKENLALALRGTVSSVEADSVVDEAVVATLDGLVPLAHLNASDVVVKNAAGSTTYVLGTDYLVTGAGIKPLSTGSITENQALKVSYDYPDQDVIEALTTGAGEYTVYFDGLNEAENNTNVSVVLHKAKFGLAKSVGLISDDYVNLEIEGELLVDASQIGVGKSKFYRWTYPGA